jgi:hypothetical protein
MLTKIPTVSAPADNLSVEADRLIDGSINWFSDWPTADVPRSGAVVYTIWNREGFLIYVGMSGRSLFHWRDLIWFACEDGRSKPWIIAHGSKGT